MDMSKKPRVLNPQPHVGEHELIIGIDVGTTFSGVCYAFLRPGEIPNIQSVTKFTDQGDGDSKIPSIMYYDKGGKLRATGATAALENVEFDAEDQGWKKVEFFKMHLRPPDIPINTNGLDLGTLPSGKTATDVMGDFLRYLYSETMEYIRRGHSDSNDLLSKVKDSIRFVLSHPNGWMGLPQQRMREAAIRGGLVKDSDDARSRIRFVSEGEASALSCLASGFCPPTFEKGFRFMIADLGGGTLDTTSYEVTSPSPLRLKELTSSDCSPIHCRSRSTMLIYVSGQFAGSLFVNIKARELLEKLLHGSHYANSEELKDAINNNFEKKTKREFKDASKPSRLRIADRGENDTKLRIRRGCLKIDGKEMAQCFEHSVSEALKSIKGQLAKCGGKAMPVWLVGGFASSDWLFHKLESGLRRDKVDVRRPPSTNLAKAVAHGNVLYSLESTVLSRVTRSTYGVVCSPLYRKSDRDHRRRRHLRYTSLSGEVRIPGMFDAIVNKDEEVEEAQRFNTTYSREIEQPRLAAFENELWNFKYEGPAPKWYDENEELFDLACTIKADLSKLCRISNVQVNNGKIFWKLEYDIEIMFGLTELQARIKWVENGETKYGPATIFYDEE